MKQTGNLARWAAVTAAFPTCGAFAGAIVTFSETETCRREGETTIEPLSWWTHKEGLHGESP